MTTKPTYSELRQMLVDIMAMYYEYQKGKTIDWDVYSRARDMLDCFPEPTQVSNKVETDVAKLARLKHEGYEILIDNHSPTPAEVLDHWLFCREEYFNNLNNTKIDHEDQQASDAHLQMLDEQLKELDEAAEDVNKLFNYSSE